VRRFNSVFKKNIDLYRRSYNNFNFHDVSTGNLTGIVVIAIVAVLVFFFMKVMEFFLIIYAVKTSNGENYKYPLSIPFF
jgi:uncharacterized Tic20 family protein